MHAGRKCMVDRIAIRARDKAKSDPDFSGKKFLSLVGAPTLQK